MKRGRVEMEGKGKEERTIEVSGEAMEVEVEGEGDTLVVMPIGAGNEVGRSCIILSFRGKTVMLDCGIHPAYSGHAGLPYFDRIDEIADIDLLLVSHFHLDHAASLPYFLSKTEFQGRVFMTHPTKAIYKMLLSDYIRVSNQGLNDDEVLYTEADLEDTMDRIELVHYHQVVQHNGIKFWSYNAGHVLGAAMFMIEIDGVRILYTGDYSREEDRHLMSAEIPQVRPDLLIIESTYGVQIHEERSKREKRFTDIVKNIIVDRRGKVLLPVFALGRAQELLLIIDEFWATEIAAWESNERGDNPELSPSPLRDVPIFYASQLAKKALNVFQTYVTYMNHRIRNQISVNNPFKFKYIKNLSRVGEMLRDNNSVLLSNNKQCVVFASPGMLQSGLSRRLFELWCGRDNNGVVLTGYSVEGTLAKELSNKSSPTHIESVVLDPGKRLRRQCRVEEISFSAHCDFRQTSEFIDALKPPHIVLVHGEASQMSRLKSTLMRKYSKMEQAAQREKARALAAQKGAPAAAATTADAASGEASVLPVTTWKPEDIYTPNNQETVEIRFKSFKNAKVVGSIAEMVPGEGHPVGGIIVKKDFELTLLAEKDLSQYTSLVTSSINQAISIPFQHAMLPQLITALLQVYANLRVEKVPSASEQNAAASARGEVKQEQDGTPAAAAVKKEEPKAKQEPGTGAAQEDDRRRVAIVVEERIRIRLDGGMEENVAVGDTLAAAEKTLDAEGDGPVDPRKRMRLERQRKAMEEKRKAELEARKQRFVECVVVEWHAGLVEDMIADSVVAIVCNVMVSPNSVMASSTAHMHLAQQSESWREELVGGIEAELPRMMEMELGEECVMQATLIHEVLKRQCTLAEDEIVLNVEGGNSSVEVGAVCAVSKAASGGVEWAVMPLSEESAMSSADIAVVDHVRTLVATLNSNFIVQPVAAGNVK